MSEYAERNIKDDRAEEIRTALKKMGYSDAFAERIKLIPIDEYRTKVKHGNAPFGVYDFTRHTFVD